MNSSRTTRELHFSSFAVKVGEKGKAKEATEKYAPPSPTAAQTQSREETPVEGHRATTADRVTICSSIGRT